jgi:uncharacterized protein (DUF1330 family)
MRGYIIAKVNITNIEQYQQYMKATPSTISKYGGKIIVRGGEISTLEGDPVNERIVIIEFPSSEMAKTWYDSVEYQNTRKLREGAAEVSFIAINGVE